MWAESPQLWRHEVAAMCLHHLHLFEQTDGFERNWLVNLWIYEQTFGHTQCDEQCVMCSGASK